MTDIVPASLTNGMGLGVKTNVAAAGPLIGNLLLRNMGLPINHEHYKVWLYCNSVKTQWQLNGSTAQSRSGRVFYPRNTLQGDLTFNCQWPNQDLYFQFIEFLQFHYDRAIQDITSPLSIALPRGQYRMESSDGTTMLFDVHKGMALQGYIRNMQALLDTTSFAPEAPIVIHVTEDFEHKEILKSQMLNDALQTAYTGGLAPNGSVQWQDDETDPWQENDTSSIGDLVQSVVDFGSALDDEIKRIIGVFSGGSA